MSDSKELTALHPAGEANGERLPFPVPLPVEIDLNVVHRQHCTPELDHLFAVRRGDQFKLVFGFTFQQGKNGFPVFDVV